MRGALLSSSSSEEKGALRAAIVAARARLTPEERQARSLVIARRVEALDAVRAARTLAAYAALGAEVDPSPLVEVAAARGVRVVFPRVVPGDRRLSFASCAPGELQRGALGAGEPPPGALDVPLDAIDAVILPGVAFTPDGHRLGRGGGYYDATLAAMPRALKVGLAFDLQIVPSLPFEAHDVRLDAIATELRLLLSRGVSI
jgi:5-formyltetrahydrofolate cyclo-ligase